MLLALVAAAALSCDLENVVDVKPYANRVYGIRQVERKDAATLWVTLGATASVFRNTAEAWRIVSDDDPAYAYEKFVRPVGAKEVESKVEFPYPAGRKVHAKGSLPLERSVVELKLPTPMKPKCRYAVVAHGAGQNECVTAALTGSYVGEGEGDRWAARIVGLRQVESVGGGVIRCEFGAGYSPQGGDVASNWQVTVGGKPVQVRVLGRRAKIDFYKTAGWPYGAVLVNDVFLDLGAALKDGDGVAVAVTESVTCGERTAKLAFDSAKSHSSAIQANQVGYLPEGAKEAYLSRWFGSCGSLRLASEPGFEVVDERTGRAADGGVAKFIHAENDPEGRNKSNANVWRVDFTPLTKPGRYFIRIAGVGRSIAFDIAKDVYARPFKVQAQGIYCQRCGTEIDPKLSGGWTRISCHDKGVVATTQPYRAAGEHGGLAENQLKGTDGKPVVLKAKGGHHDAGDYNPRSHLDVAQALLDLYELKSASFTDAQLNVPERGNGIPDLVDEALWEIRLWMGLQDEDGGVCAGTESAGDPGFFQTVELDDKGDYAWAKDVPASYGCAAVFAQASRILKGCGKAKAAADLLRRAERSYAWAEGHAKGDVSASKACAAASLYNTTGDAKWHEAFKALVPWTKDPRAEISVWGKYNMAMAARQYLLLPKERRDAALWDTVLDRMKFEMQGFISGCEKSPYRFLRNPWAPITWGTGAYENFAISAAFVYAITGDATSRDWLIRTCDNTLGANPLGMCWITGLGARTIRCPLHNCRYRPNGLPVDGLQEQGPMQGGHGYSFKETVFPAFNENVANMHCWIDSHFAIAMDEPTVSNMANTLLVFGVLMK